jgi:mycothiol synthase
LFAACDLADVGFEDHQPAWIVDTWQSPMLRGAWLVHDGAGELAGYVELESSDPSSSVYVFLPIHPRHRAALRPALLRWALVRADEVAQGSPAVRVTFAAEDDGAAADTAAEGLVPVRRFWHLERTLDPSVTEPSPPPGVTVRSFVSGVDAHAVWEILTAAFEGHFGIDPLPFDGWLAEIASSAVWDASLVFLGALDGRDVGVLVGFDADGVAWVGELGVQAEARGRGVGTALLHRAFATFAARGLRRVRLNVDPQNETGATGLYAGLGMRPRRTWHVYELPVVAE